MCAKMRYAFAMSSFGRMFRPDGITYQMNLFCKEWAEGDEKVPTEWTLDQVDQFFLEHWRNNMV